MNYFELHKEYLNNEPSELYIEAVRDWYDCIEFSTEPLTSENKFANPEFFAGCMAILPMNIMILTLDTDKADDMMNGVRSWLNTHEGVN